MKGTDREGKPLSGTVTWRDQFELEAHIPLSPPLDEVTIQKVIGLTHSPTAPSSATFELARFKLTTSLNRSPRWFLPCRLWKPWAEHHQVQVSKLNRARRGAVSSTWRAAEKPVSRSQRKYRYKKTKMKRAVYFSALSECDKLFGDHRARSCTQRLPLTLTVVEILRPQPGWRVFFAKWTIKAKVDLSKQVVDVIKSKNGKVTIGTQGGKAVATGPGSSLVAQGAGNVISNDGNSLISQDAGTVVSNDGNSLISGDARDGYFQRWQLSHFPGCRDSHRPGWNFAGNKKWPDLCARWRRPKIGGNGRESALRQRRRDRDRSRMAS